ncbi:phytanoyl-CoA dioxygenase, peroxisomal [Tribolium castaneum]|uniref:phytanoyl-CoA dioxygenase n=1 Tax=Tribolium castaneum TaxID=7070 RepID=D6WU68_TRICA|nr:PREDICTED: phytanoyl-CoA dioxygenase, peroxisomal [Tribolium castaneum]EFA06775.2 Phytanoyl-CoA dioxygenase, peroxisomal-like Protein [Tribolium castaneum]|eukprot:XP_969641.1 PREDICTED: phytanoyl-CoA dioxygenase, peroxisomal [Tribolium castaneum]
MGRFRYTQDGGVLTYEQRQFYEDNGYIVIKNNVSHALLDEIQDRFIKICDGVADPGFMTVMKDPSLKHKGVRGQYLINKIQDFLYDEVLFKYCSDKPVVDVIESIIGPNITGAHSMLINKPPDADPGASLHPLHQDLHYFPFRPADRIAASWTAMERVDENNGCLYVIPGSHKWELYPHTYPQGYKNRLYHGVQGLDHLPKVNVVMEKGDTVFFHPILLHGSGPNRTKGFRKAISCHYADSNCYFIDVRGTLQEHIAEEIETLAKKKGAPMKFVEIWKAKSRLVRGIPGNFQNLESHL